MEITQAMHEHMESYASRITQNKKLKEMYVNCYPNTFETALVPCPDNTYFVLTGDIPAMWLRDSSAQVTHYLPLSGDKATGDVIEGVIKRQLMYIETDSYANAFNIEPNGKGHPSDLPKNGPWVFERKYEIDSLCYPIRLLYMFWKAGKRESLIKECLESIARIILNQWKTEQHHMEESPYRFFRDLSNKPDRPWDSIHNNGLGAPVTYTGMTWSGFRPSDDACEYGYLIASEMFACVILGYMSEMLDCVCKNAGMAAECRILRNEIDEGIKKYGIIEHEKYGKIYACETDGFGHYTLIDDANVPSLLSIPYIGYADKSDEIYKNTRRFLLSNDNPFYFEGKCAKGIGSRHTPANYIWHMALVMQGLTSDNAAEKLEMLHYLTTTDAGKGFLHEGFDCNDDRIFTREWFTWPNSLFAEFIEQCVDEGIVK